MSLIRITNKTYGIVILTNFFVGTLFLEACNDSLTRGAGIRIIKDLQSVYAYSNDISRKDIGFSSDFNEVSILKNDGTVKHLERADKYTIAKNILEEIYG